MFDYLKTISNTLETVIWSVLMTISVVFAFAIIYKILHADKIKAGPVEITDEAEPEIKPEEIKK